MTSMVADKLARLLCEYERKSNQSKLDIATRMDIAISNYSTYCSGTGNPTAKTLSKLIAVILEEEPEIWVSFILKELLTGYPDIFWKSLRALVEEEDGYDRAAELAIPGSGRGDR